MRKKLREEIETMIAIEVEVLRNYIDRKTELTVELPFFLSPIRRVQLKQAVHLVVDYLGLEFEFKSSVPEETRLVKSLPEAKPLIYKAKKIKVKPRVK